MSPASQGALEVERYIGSCLISSTGRASSGLQKPLLASSGCRKQDLQQQQQPQSQQLRNSKQQCQQSQFGAVGTWAGGAPLISMASNPRRNQRSPPGQQQQQQQQLNDQRVPLARLAVHTQGAPLILSTGRFHNGGNARAKVHNGAAAIANCVAGLTVGNAGNVSANLARCQPPPRLNKVGAVATGEQKKPQQQAAGAKDAGGKETTTTNIDSLSIASDESSGSNNSENSLPRIIKPRKRRKKDRKPPPVVGGGPAVVGGVATASNPASDVKTADEGLQQSPSMPGNNAATIEQQMKPYQAYDGGARYVNGDGYYKGQRRPINANNNGNNNGYGRVNGSPASSAPSNGAVNAQSQEVVDTRQRGNNYSQQQQQQHRHVQVKVLDDNRNVILPVPVCQAKAGYLRHNQHNGGNARFLHDYNEPVTLACHQEHSPPGAGPIDECLQQQQCRYCDPATLVWDVSEQNGFPYLGHQSADYHHHHHHHHHRYSQLPAAVFLTRPFICQEGHHVFDVADNPCQLRLRPAEGLRRSWSDPSSYFSNGEMAGSELLPNRDVGVIGDRGQSGTESALKGSWRGDASAATPSGQNSSLQSSSSPLSSGPGSPGLQGPLEVSTEIVTSPNGHRDLEIKFYSSSPTTSSYDCSSDELKTFAFPDDEELSDDIWSYHESKLQQDFRTLLQAEE